MNNSTWAKVYRLGAIVPRSIEDIRYLDSFLLKAPTPSLMKPWSVDPSLHRKSLGGGLGEAGWRFR